MQGQRTTYRNETPVEEQGYYPELIYREAAQFIEERGSAPFFLFLSLALPHLPLQVPKKYSAVYAHIPSQNRATYAGMVSCLDQGVGEVMTALENKGFSDNTLVIFLSDHGWVKLPRNPSVAAAGDNGALRGDKYELTEGGLRVPCVVRWPGQVRPGSVSGTPTMTLDWAPTIQEVAGLDENPLHRLDGVNLLALLVGTGEPRPRTLLWAFEDTLVGTPPSFAARKERWKLLQVGDEKMLVDLLSDPGETKDVSAQNLKMTRDLELILEGWRRELRI